MEKKELQPEEELETMPKKKKARKKRGIGGIIIAVVGILLAAGIGFFGFMVYRDYYRLNVDGVTVDGGADWVEVQVQSNIDESLLQVVCTDAYGTQIFVPLQDGKAVFENLAPDSHYRISLLVDGFHELTGKTTATYSTPPQTQILQISAVTGSEDGSVILAFTLEGPDSGDWSVAYQAPGVPEQTQKLDSHTVELTGLTVDREYTFTLVPGKDMYVTGERQIKYMARNLVYAQQLQVISCTDGALTAVWNAPEDAQVGQWTVRCYGDSFDETIVTNETTAVFSGLDTADAYNVEVIADGMSVSQLVNIGKNSLTISNFQADTQEPGKMALRWDCSGGVPQGGWKVHYSIDGIDSGSVSAQDNSAVISPMIPEADYEFYLVAENGADVLTQPLSYQVPDAVEFSGYGIEPDNITVNLCATADAAGWEEGVADEKDFTSRFGTGEGISMVLQFAQSASESTDMVDILYVIRDKEGNLVSFSSDAKTWETLWKENYGLFEVLKLPEEVGAYTVSLYFNGRFVAEKSFKLH